MIYSDGKPKVMYFWNVQYHCEAGMPALKFAIPNQVKAASFAEASEKCEAYLASLGYGDQIRVNGIHAAGQAVLE
jgi:hypothetical protein